MKGDMAMANEEKPKLRFDATPEEIKAIYEKLKREFSLDDLKAFEVDEKDTIPFSSLLADVEAMVRDAKSKRKSG
jgi:hypothetical protein